MFLVVVSVFAFTSVWHNQLKTSEEILVASTSGKGHAVLGEGSAEIADGSRPERLPGRERPRVVWLMSFGGSVSCSTRVAASFVVYPIV